MTLTERMTVLMRIDPQTTRHRLPASLRQSFPTLPENQQFDPAGAGRRGSVRQEPAHRSCHRHITGAPGPYALCRHAIGLRRHHDRQGRERPPLSTADLQQALHL